MATGAKARQEKRRASAKQMVEKHESGGSKALRVPEAAKFFKFKKEGTYRLDFLPYDVKSAANPTADKGSLGVCRPYYVHRDIGPGEDTYLCAAKTLGKPCPICEHRAKLAREGADDDVIKALKPKERTLYNVIDTANREDGVQLLDYSDWLLGKYLRGKIEGADPKERDAFELYADLSEGMTVKIVTTEEKGAGGSWMVCNNIEFKPRDKQYEDEMLSKTFDLDAIISETPYEKLRAIFLQEPAATKDEPEDEPESPERAEIEFEWQLCVRRKWQYACGPVRGTVHMGV